MGSRTSVEAEVSFRRRGVDQPCGHSAQVARVELRADVAVCFQPGDSRDDLNPNGGSMSFDDVEHGLRARNDVGVWSERGSEGLPEGLLGNHDSFLRLARRP